MALNPNALTTVVTVEPELKIPTGTQDALLQRLINAASDAIEKYCGRKFFRDPAVIDKLAGYGTNRLTLSRTPVESITSVVLDSTTLDPSEYTIEDASAGFLYRPIGWPPTAKLTPGTTYERLWGSEERLIVVTYAGGYSLPKDNRTPGTGLPYDVEQACIDTVVRLYRDRGKYASLQTETEAQEDVSWRGMFIPGPARKQLDLYRRIA